MTLDELRRRIREDHDFTDEQVAEWIERASSLLEKLDAEKSRHLCAGFSELCGECTERLWAIERRAVVKWLREGAWTPPRFVAYGDDDGRPDPDQLADAIERGEHLK